MNDKEILEEMQKLHAFYGKLSAVLLQRKFRISFDRAEKYIEEFEHEK